MDQFEFQMGKAAFKFEMKEEWLKLQQQQFEQRQQQQQCEPPLNPIILQLNQFADEEEVTPVDNSPSPCPLASPETEATVARGFDDLERAEEDASIQFKLIWGQFEDFQNHLNKRENELDQFHKRLLKLSNQLVQRENNVGEKEELVQLAMCEKRRKQHEEEQKK